jgi:hypothetical protein
MAERICVSWKSRVPELNIGDADTAEKLSCTGIITLYILSIATFIVLQSIFPQPTDNLDVDPNKQFFCMDYHSYHAEMTSRTKNERKEGRKEGRKFQSKQQYGSAEIQLCTYEARLRASLYK